MSPELKRLFESIENLNGSEPERALKAEADMLKSELRAADRIIELQKSSIAHLHERIREAEEVIAFYADKEMFKTGSDVSYSLGFDGEDYEYEQVAIMNDNGKRAREYQKKYETKPRSTIS